MSKKENFNWIYLFKRSASLLSLCAFLFVNIVFLTAYLQRENNEERKRKSTFNVLSL